MQFSGPLIRARLIKRYKRFLADVTLEDGTDVTVHCANPGAMIGLAEPDTTVWLTKSNNPKRKLAYSWELSETEQGLVGINTGHPNKIVKEALLAQAVPELAAYGTVRPEVMYGEGSRVDFLLSQDGLPDAYVEVKNVHLFRQPDLAEFPDSVTARGTKHLKELANMARSGCRAVMLYLIQRDNCEKFSIASDIDPTYAASLTEACKAGVEVIAYNCHINKDGIAIGGSVAYIDGN